MAHSQPVFIALGANLGNPRQAIAEALGAIGRIPGVTLVAASDLLANRPVDCPEGSPEYVNAVCEVAVTLEPRELLEELLALEAAMGRHRTSVRNESRTIDLDILLFGSEVWDEPGLTIPHPRMHQRDFVLLPLSWIAPQARHPLLQRSISELLDDLLPNHA